MSKKIFIQPLMPVEEIEKEARELLETGIYNGNDAVLDMAIYIASRDHIDVEFCIIGTNRVFDPDLAYRMRFLRGLNIREVPENEKRKP